MKINTYLKYRSIDKGESPVYLNIAYSGFRFKFYTGDKVLPGKWDFKRQKHKSDTSLNIKLSNWINLIPIIERDFYNENKAHPLPDTLKTLLKFKLRQIEQSSEQPDTFLSFFEKLIQRSLNGSRQPKKKLIQYSTIQTYKRVKQTLIEFIDKTGYKLDFLTLDHNFYSKYSEKLISDSYSSNTIGKYLSVVKMVALEAADSGFSIHPYIKSRKFVITRQKDIDNIFLNENQIAELERLDLKLNPTLDRVRDLFLFGCYTGLRYSDINRLDKNCIQNEYIYLKKTQKTGQSFEIIINEQLSRLVQKYKGSFPKKMSNQKVNKYLKDIGQLIPSLQEKFEKEYIKGGKSIITNKPKWELLSTHTARRSYCTNAYLNGIAIQDIMAVSGHKSEKSFRVYLKMKDSDHAKAANARKLNFHKLKIAN